MKSNTRLGGCSYTFRKEVLAHANHISCWKVHCDNSYQRYPLEGSRRKKQPPLGPEVTGVLAII